MSSVYSRSDETQQTGPNSLNYVRSKLFADIGAHNVFPATSSICCIFSGDSKFQYYKLEQLSNRSYQFPKIYIGIEV